MTGKMINAIVGAYDHAREKHPYFCDWLKPDAKSVADIRRVVDGLNMARARVADAITAHNVGWDDLLDCEVWEILDALANGDTAHAVSECYDAIAVLLRTVDVLEGRQPLGNPRKGRRREMSGQCAACALLPVAVRPGENERKCETTKSNS